jgi:hypothetical protein
MPAMLKVLPVLLLLAAATSASATVASAAPDDTCSTVGVFVREITDARDGGVMMSKFMMNRAEKFKTAADREFVFRMIARIYLSTTETADELVKGTVNDCIRTRKT